MHLGRRIAFRCCLVYLVLYALTSPLLGGLLLLPGLSLPALGTVWPLRDVTTWAAEQIFGLSPPFVFNGNSGDTAFHWVQTALLLASAVLVTGTWTLLDRARTDHVALYAWVRLFIRIALAAQMFYFGMAKVVPSQFPPPSLVTLVSPVGTLSLSDLLWTFIGASTPYQIFTGCAELAAGLLLLTARTTPLGALIGAADMLQVFVLNMTYDVGLKGISFHLLLMCVFLLAPDLRRLANVLVLDRPAGPSTTPPLFSSPRANRRAAWVQVMLGAYLLLMFSSLALRYYYAEGGAGAPKSPLYGIWQVEQMSVDGRVQLPLLNDYDRRWRRVIFDAPGVVVFQRTDDSFAHYRARLDERRATLVLNKGTSRTWQSSFTVDRPAADRILLEGEMDGQQIRVQLRRLELDTFRLLNSTFRWVRPPEPFAG